MIIYIIALIVFGIVLLVLEILILPGLIAGIIGGLFILFGLSWTFASYGNEAGVYTSLATFAATALAIYLSLRSKMWNKFSLTTDLAGSRMNVLDSGEIKTGDTAHTLSALRPMGTIIIAGKRVEAQTNGELIPADTEVIITKILPDKVIVKLKTETQDYNNS